MLDGDDKIDLELIVALIRHIVLNEEVGEEVRPCLSGFRAAVCGKPLLSLIGFFRSAFIVKDEKVSLLRVKIYPGDFKLSKSLIVDKEMEP